MIQQAVDKSCDRKLPPRFHHPLPVEWVVMWSMVLLCSCGEPSSNERDHPARPPERKSAASGDPVIEDSYSLPLESDLEVALAPLENLSNARFQGRLAAEMERVSPTADGSETEEFSAAADAQLKLLGKMLEHAGQLTPDELIPFLSTTFEATSLIGKGGKESTAFEKAGIAVHRMSEQQSEDTNRPIVVGANGFSEALRELAGPAASLDVRSKIINVLIQPDGRAVTRVLVQANSRENARRIQQNASWLCKWEIRENESAPPRLRRIDLIDYEKVVLNPSTGPSFSDCTESALVHNDCYKTQLVHGIDYWRERIDWRFQTELLGPHGLAIGDVNGDGLDDLFLCAAGGLPNRLFLQRQDGTLEDVAKAWQVDFIEPTYGALLVDLDNDSDQDLAFTSGRYLLIFENVGNRFEQRILRPSDSIARSLNAADYDLDGDLDIFVCGYYSRTGDSIGIGLPVPYHDANNGVPNYLLQNAGDWNFTDVTRETGLDTNNMRFSYAAAWEDYDQDGDPDLYVANDFGRNNLYRNDSTPDGRNRFVDVAAAAGVEDISAGMSVSWGDYNADGLPDIYVGNMFSSAGNRVAYQREFRPADDSGVRNLFRRHARGNSLFANSGDGKFKDVTRSSGTNMGRWAWGSLFCDLNNDGWEDLLVANGLVTSPDDSGDL
jgi:hypothetical protein